MSVYVFTSIALNYLAKARVTSRSLKRFHPDMKMHLLLNEPMPKENSIDFSDFDAVHTIEMFGDRYSPGWIFRHNLAELSTAIKPRYQEYLMSLPDCEAVIYLDPDTALFSPMHSILDSLGKSSIVLTPHLLDPESDTRAIVDNEQHVLRYGVYNLGFLAVKNSSEGQKFTAWWRERVEYLAIEDLGRGVYMDQLWVDLAPCFFEDLHILRDRGVNVATWNIGHRRISGNFEEGFRVNDGPLVLFHFSGIDRGAQKVMLDLYASDQPAAYLLRDWYLEETMGLESAVGALPWKYSTYSNGVSIPLQHRRVYAEHQVLQLDYPNPFDAACERDSYFQWCARNLGRSAEKSENAQRITGFHEKKYEPREGLTLLEEYLLRKPNARPSPTPQFDAEYYLANNEDVLRSGMNPFEHFIRYGLKEGRTPFPPQRQAHNTKMQS